MLWLAAIHSHLTFFSDFFTQPTVSKQKPRIADDTVSMQLFARDRLNPRPKTFLH